MGSAGIVQKKSKGIGEGEEREEKGEVCFKATLMKG